MSSGESLRGVLACEHDIQQNTNSVDIRPGIALCDAQLLRGGIANGAHDDSVLASVRYHSGGVEVNQNHSPVTANYHILRLHIPVDKATFMQDV